MFKQDDATSLPFLFHLNSEPWLNFEAYADPAAEVKFKQITPAGNAVALPRAEQTTSLNELLAKRHSCRHFAPRPMALGQVAALLLNGYGGLNVITNPNGVPGLVRPVPSAGGLYSLELYAMLTNVGDLADGLYHYNALHHRLEPMGAAAVTEIHNCLLAPNFLEHANFVLIITSVFDRCLRKYGPRGYRYVLLEAGHVAQNLCLIATEVGLGALCVGGFCDSALNRLLGLDETQEGALYVVGIGSKEP
jgi:SagB-type dehydrogenase family enzyme